ncbi:hypothetical protein CLV30_11553 [Haloactinopolyspora alba]|uniref:Uncharacterized protein n=1 Tax=Haloactinopolyspora alba TaxID=648780 RepID=A0A2P8DV57_9ACTN|nr:hypothetical protein [Haloactinopolyspora alba]PSL01118.1 hypothetical protein CLV30_11553 [Haloactinopolyspora alba]
MITIDAAIRPAAERRTPEPTDDLHTSVGRTGARHRNDSSLVGRLNSEWTELCAAPTNQATVSGWAAVHGAIAGCADLRSVEAAVAGAAPEQADEILLALVRLGHDGDELATRTVLQLMLGKAVRIAASHAGRDTRDNLEQATVTALWTVIATYPVERRHRKVAANIAMDTLRIVVGELAPRRHELPAGADIPHAVAAQPTQIPADLELLELLAWAVDTGAVSAQEATLIVDIHAPAPGQRGGADAAARHGFAWPAARQRVSRAVRRIARSVHADTHERVDG